jgi:hypothetical protein
VTDEGVILDGHALADERVTGDLAAPPDGRVLLNLDEGADLGFVADRAPVQIDEFTQPDALTEPDVRRNFGVFVQCCGPVVI